MALKINLKSHEAIYVGMAKVTVASEGRVTLLVDGDTPVLRAAESIAEPPESDHAARLQYVIQQMYLAHDIASFHEEYFALAQKLVVGNAEMAQHVANINCYLVEGAFYRALKLARLTAEISARLVSPTQRRAS